MIYLIGGDNNYESVEALKQCIQRYTKQGMQFEQVYIDDENAISRILNCIQNRNLFSEQRAVIVKAIELATKEQFETLLACMNDETEMVLWSRKRLDKRSKLYKQIKTNGKVLEFEMPKDRELKVWARSYAKRIELDIKDDLLNEVVFRVGFDPLLISKELDKLKALVDEGVQVSMEMIKDFVPRSAEVSVWDLVDSLTQKDKSICYGLLDQLKDTIEYEFIMGMIIRQVRLLYLGSVFKDRASLIQFGIHPFVASKIVQQSQKLSTQRLKKLYEKMVDMEISVKSGRLEKTLALDLLVTAF